MSLEPCRPRPCWRTSSRRPWSGRIALAGDHQGLGRIAVWTDVASQLAAHRAAGRRHLLTEDTVRMCTVLSLEGIGVAPEDLRIEVFDPVLHGGKVDLVVTSTKGRTIVELKYPR